MTRVGVIGYGAVGSVVADALHRGDVAGCTLAGVLTRRTAGSAPREVRTIDALVEAADLVVEAGGHDAVAAYGSTVVSSGRDLLVVSVGALVDDGLRARLTGGDGGRLLVSAGAIGGLELLRAALLLGELRSVALTTTKAPGALVAPWMGPGLRDRLRSCAEVVDAFDGPAREAVARFPQSANVAATLALSTVGFDRTAVRMVGDPGASRVRHVIRAEGEAGCYELHIENAPSANPRTSAITPYSVIRALGDMGARVVVGV